MVDIEIYLFSILKKKKLQYFTAKWILKNFVLKKKLNKLETFRYLV